MKLTPRTIEKKGQVSVVIAGTLDDGAAIEEREVDRYGIGEAAQWLAELEGRPALLDAFAVQITKLLEEAELLSRVRKSIKRSKEPADAFDLVEDLAKLSVAEMSKAKVDLKAKLGKELNLNDLSRAVTEFRKKARENLITDRTATGEDGLLRVCVTNRQLRDISDDALLALTQENNPPALFIRAGELVRLAVDEKERTSITPLTEPALRGRLERSANFFGVTKDGEEFVERPPIDVCKDLLSLNVNEQIERLEYRKLPALEAVVESPVVRGDGTLLLKPGYDQKTRLYYSPVAGMADVRVAENPSGEEVAAAAKIVDEVIHEFPFVDDASRANFWAYLVTLVARPAIDGKVPLVMFDKPTPGTGGSLLAEAAITIVTGRDAIMYGAPADDEEWRKLITSVLSAGAATVLVDNVEHVLESDSLARVITCTEWGDRILGQSKGVTIPARAVWAVTGNNVSLGRNIARRCYQVRLDAKEARPDKRTGFQHPELLPWIIENRRRIVTALLTICRSWFAAGKPPADTPVMGSFEAWSRTIGGILAHAGITGFLTNREEMLNESAEESRPWEAFLIALEAKYGLISFSVAQVEKDVGLDTALRDALPGELAVLVQLLPATSPVQYDRVKIDAKFKIKLGKAFQKRTGMRFGDGVDGIFVERAGEDSHRKITLWRIAKGSGLPATPRTPRTTPREVNDSDSNGLYESAGNAGSVSHPYTYEKTHHTQGVISEGGGRKGPTHPTHPPQGEVYEDDEREALNEPGM